LKLSVKWSVKVVDEVVDKDFSQADPCFWFYKAMSVVVIESY